MSVEDAEVLVVGGGLAGLSTAMFLAWQGVSVRLVERRAQALRHPRARAVNNRTMELYRRLDLGPAIHAERSHADEAGALLLRARSLAGEEIWRRDAVPPAGSAATSPCPWGSIDQDKLEILVRRRAEELGADIRFGTELRSPHSDGDGVRAVVTGPAGTSTVRARYLVVADGSRSAIRSSLGIAMDGPGVLGEVFTFVFEADLSEPLRGRRVVVAHLEEPKPGTVILPYDGQRKWVFSAPYTFETDGAPEHYPSAHCVELVRAAVGVPDLAVRLLPQLVDGTRMLTYQLGASVARRYRAGPMFLVGDAAHVLPPAGAFGASTGVQDAHNLAWKLAAVLRGEAGEALLDSYETERRLVARFTLDQALRQMEERTGRPAAGASAAPVDYHAVVLGYRYPVNGEPRGDTALSPDQLRGQPGTRAPHVAVVRDGAEISTIDLYGPGFTLVAGAAAEGWTAAARALRTGGRLAVYQVGVDIRDERGSFCAAHDLPDDGAILVRPDGFVAWRTDGTGGPSTAILRRAVARTLRHGQG
jgi:2-polyprenyl-6-methoxyphenol hydroxylase-like FAD-dependent oxidoreductase